jgi:single-strand DNA-binding protein
MAGKSVNKVILVGNLGKDPEVKYTQSGMPVAKFTIATNERFKDKDGQWQDRTEWHNLVAFQRTAEIVGEYLKKGGKVYIEGSLRTSSWDDKESGQKKYRTEILVNDLVLLGGRGEGGGGDFARGAGASAGGDHHAGEHMDQRVPEHAAASGGPISDEDIPF